MRIEDWHGVASSLQMLALIQQNIGNYGEAESLYLKAIPVLKASFSEKNISYISALEKLASLYNKMSNYSDAEKFYAEICSTHSWQDR